MSAITKPKTEAEKNAAKFPPAKSVAKQLLSNAQASREVVQDFVPLAESLEWELGQQYLKDRGAKAFISDASPVPFVINNDGTLSRNAAEVFFESLVEAEEVGELEPEIFVLELGIGVGLFARFFLDNLRELCTKHNKDYYDRLRYIAGDISERMLMDVLQHGVLQNHVGHYATRIVNAMEPEKYLLGDPLLRGHPHKDKPLRAVFLNYLLDCLPAAALEFVSDTEEVKQLYVRTCVARNIKLADHTDMTVDQLRERAKSSLPGARQELLEVYGLFASEYDYQPVNVDKLPYGAFVKEFSRRYSRRVLLSWGAIQSLEKLLALVHDDGFILVNDYGQTQVTREDEFEHQRFSLATFVGLNFPLLKEYFDEGKRCHWTEPTGGDPGGIHSRLLGHKLGSKTRFAFNQCFGTPAHDKLQEPVNMARQCARVGRFELAATYYYQAIDLQPNDWVLLNEISMFLTFSLRDLKAGIDMAKEALRFNPTCSAELWNTLGDGLYEFGRTAEARSAYLKALRVNDADVRARYNLAWCHTREKNFPAALEMIAEAIALDKTGEYRERLLHKQQEVLTQVSLRHQQEYLLLINLVSKYAKKDEREKPERPGVPEHTTPASE